MPDTFDDELNSIVGDDSFQSELESIVGQKTAVEESNAPTTETFENWVPNRMLAREFQQKPPSFTNTGLMSGAREFYQDTDPKSVLGALGYVGYTLGIPQQIVSRQVVNMLESIGQIKPEEAKMILSEEEVSPSDILKIYWRNPKGRLESYARTGIGFLSDVLLDPLNLIGIGAARAGLKVAGKSIPAAAIAKLSTKERAALEATQNIEHLLTTENDLIKVGKNVDEAADATLVNQELARKFATGQITKEKFAESLITSSEKAGASIASKADNIVKKTYQDQGAISRLASGRDTIKIGARIPWTNIGFETEFGTSGRALSKGIGNTFMKLGQLGSGTLSKIPGFDKASLFLSSWRTKTGNAFFDGLVNNFHGGTRFAQKTMDDWRRAQTKIINDEMKLLGLNEQEKIQYMEDIIDELEFAVDDPSGLLQKHSKKPWFTNAGEEIAEGGGKFTPLIPSPEAQQLIPTAEDIARRQRLGMRPGAMDAIESMKKLREDIKGIYEARPNMPFADLNPFGKGWANNYVPRIVNKRYLDYIRKAEDDSLDLLKETVSRNPNAFDKSVLQRESRRYLTRLNEESMKKTGIKMFIDDPVELFADRYVSAYKSAALHDMINKLRPIAIVPTGTGTKAAALARKEAMDLGYVKVDPNSFRDFGMSEGVLRAGKAGEIQTDQLKLLLEDPNVPLSVKEQLEKSFRFSTRKGNLEYVENLPAWFRENEVYLPPRALDKLLYMTTPPQGSIAEAMSKWNRYVMPYIRNYALSGPHYIGMNLTTNHGVYLEAGGKLSGWKEAFKTLVGGDDGRILIKDNLGNPVEMTRHQLLDEAINNNVLGSSGINDLKFNDVIGGVTSGREYRQNTLGHKIFNIADVAMLWGLNRRAVQYVDEIPKLGLYISRRMDGFSPQAAADAASHYFYNFNDLSRGQGVARSAIPFSSFALKTAERGIDDLKRLDFRMFQVPYKAARVLQGEFVEDEDVRETLNEVLPPWLKASGTTVHGKLLPGGREVMMELPFVVNSFGIMMNPEDSIHPVLKLMGMAIATDKEGQNTFETEWGSAPGVPKFDSLVQYMPGWLKFSAGAWALNNVATIQKMSQENPDSPITKMMEEVLFHYAPTPPTSKAQGSLQKFGKQVLTGEYLEKELNEDVLYRLLFGKYNDVPGVDSTKQLQRGITLGGRANFLKKWFRDLTLGAARITEMDAYFALHNAALKRQANALEKATFAKSSYDAFLKKDPKALEDINTWKNMAENGDSDAAKYVEIIDRRDTLRNYWEFYKGIEYEEKEKGLKPGTVFDLMFGTSKATGFQNRRDAADAAEKRRSYGYKKYFEDQIRAHTDMEKQDLAPVEEETDSLQNELDLILGEPEQINQEDLDE